jgi:hypothetical protein
MPLVARANAVLRDLGYAESEACVERREGGSATLRGSLLEETFDSPGVILQLVRSLPSRESMLRLRLQ